MKIAACALFVAMLFTACKKADQPALDEQQVPATNDRKIPGSYTQDGNTYHIYSHCLAGCSPNHEMFSVAEPTGNYTWDDPARYIRISFSESPIVGKSYHLGYNKYSGTYPPSDEVYVEVGQVNTLEDFVSKGDDGISATISLVNGKRVISISDFTATDRFAQRPDIKVSVNGLLLEY